MVDMSSSADAFLSDFVLQPVVDGTCAFLFLPPSQLI